MDKSSGYLKVDRAQRTSSLPSAIYGFIPRTYAGPRVAALMWGADGGDGDPLDICVLSERPISRAEVLLQARVVGGLPMLDHGEADDKIPGGSAHEVSVGAPYDATHAKAVIVAALEDYEAEFGVPRTEPFP